MHRLGVYKLSESRISESTSKSLDDCILIAIANFRTETFFRYLLGYVLVG